MMTDVKIKNSSELEFAVFCIENVAAKLGVDAESSRRRGCCRAFLKEKLRWRKQQGNERHCCLKKRRMRQDLKEQTMRIQPDILQKKALSSTVVR